MRSALPYKNGMLAGQHAARGSAQTLPVLDVDALVLAAVQQLVGADAGPHMPLMQAGMDSLAALELRNELSRCAFICMSATNSLFASYNNVAGNAGVSGLT